MYVPEWIVWVVGAVAAVLVGPWVLFGLWVAYVHVVVALFPEKFPDRMRPGSTDPTPQDRRPKE